jgi:hypothetical protein
MADIIKVSISGYPAGFRLSKRTDIRLSQWYPAGFWIYIFKNKIRIE